MKILVSTDTSCLINYDVLNQYPISVFPLNVIINEEEFLDGVTIKSNSMAEHMRANKVIKTSTPPLGQVIEYFEKLFEQGYDKIIHFTISSKLSSMYDLFCTVSQNFFNNNIVVIDSYSVSSLMLSHVLFAYGEVLKETPIDIIVDEIEKRKKDCYICFIPENLTALKNGGRISPTIAAIGNTLKLKPVIALSEGELVKDGTTRNVKKTFTDKVEANIINYPASKYDYTLVSFDANPSIFEFVCENVKETIKDDIIIGQLPINVCAHCGPGTIGVVVSPKINNKSLKSFI